MTPQEIEARIEEIENKLMDLHSDREWLAKQENLLEAELKSLNSQQ